MKNKRVKITSLSLVFIFCLAQTFVWVKPALAGCCVCSTRSTVKCTDGVSSEDNCVSSIGPDDEGVENDSFWTSRVSCDFVYGACAGQKTCSQDATDVAGSCVCTVNNTTSQVGCCTDGVSAKGCQHSFAPSADIRMDEDGVLHSYTCSPAAGACSGQSNCHPTSAEPMQYDNTDNNIDTSQYIPVLQVKFGNTLIKFNPVSCRAGQSCSIPWLGQYIGVVFQYIVGLAAFLAAVMIMIGGFLWLTSAGNPSRVTQGKEYITGALVGLLLALFSYIILYTINPSLVSLKPLQILSVKPSELPGFGAGVDDEINAARTGSSNNFSDKNLSELTKGAVDKYAALGCTQTSGWRKTGRHSSGRVVDFSMSSSACNEYIRSGALVADGTADNNDDNKENDHWYNKVYKMPDGSYWVDENIVQTGGSGPHWHTEFPDSEWAWQLNR
ncbi:MAG: pilin [Candidatus Buchananbacteria bacterium]